MGMSQEGRGRTRIRSVVGLTLAWGLISIPAAFAAGPPGEIRVGGPSAPGDAKLALVATGNNLVGQPFAVFQGRHVVLRGRLRSAIGSPSPWLYAATADMSGVRAPGSYSVQAGGMVSPPWQVEADATRPLIRRLLRVFQVNADGSEPNPVFGPAHLNDAHSPVSGGPTNGGTVDVSGGWRDAGDMIKFTANEAIASVMLDYVATLDPKDGPLLGAFSDIGIRFVVRAHPVYSQTFIAQVGDARDHIGDFRDPARDDSSSVPYFRQRTAYGDSGSGTLGAGAAALGSAAIRVGTASPLGRAYAALGAQWYTAGKQFAGQGPDLGPSNYSFPQPQAWQGLMALAATELWRASGNTGYLDDAAYYLHADAANGSDNLYSGFGLGNVGGLVAADLCGGLGRRAASQRNVRGFACGKLVELTSTTRVRASGDAFGNTFPFQFGWVAPALGDAALAAAGQRAGVERYGRKIAAAARDYLVGRNPWGREFILGTDGKDAHHPQSPIILKGNPSVLGNGMVVGGPASKSTLGQFGHCCGNQLTPAARRPGSKFDPTYCDDKGKHCERIIYDDNTSDYVTSEAGLEYTPPVLLLLAELSAR